MSVDPALTLISHHLCPYVQRAVISLKEKSVVFERVDVDLGNKPDWFKKLSPLGKTPVLKVGAHVIFESAVILEYLEDTQPNPLHPMDALEKAEHRSWIEFSSSSLNDIWRFYTAPDAVAFRGVAETLAEKFLRVEAALVNAPFFGGERFTLVDAVFGPVFRYFDVFDQLGDFGVFANTPKVNLWRQALAQRPSIQAAVSKDYEVRLREFLAARGSHMSRLLAGTGK